MNILITGASGFIGNSILQYIKNYNYNIFALGTQNELAVDGCTFIDYENFDFKHFNEKIDIVFHQAANNDTQSNDKNKMLLNNYYEPCRLFDHLYNNGCRKFIYASSCAVYGNAEVPYLEKNINITPLTYYGVSKKMFDDFAMNFKEDVSVIGLRYSNVYGSNEFHKNKRASMIFQIINKIKNNLNINLFKNGEQKRDWIHIDDIVKINIECVSLNCKEIINCGSGIAVSFNEIVKIVEKHFNWTGTVNFIDNDIDKTYQSLTCCNINKLKELLNITPKNVELGVEETIKAMLKTT